MTAFCIKEFSQHHSIVNRSILQAMWEELAVKVGHRDQLIIIIIIISICNAHKVNG